MIDYLTHPKFLNYNPSVLPSSQGGGGGMGTKTYRVLEALRDVYPRTQGICDASEITADTVLIEPLRFTLLTEGHGDREYESVEQLIHELQNHESRKILYCSELTLMRMPHDLREQVVGLSDCVTANCKFQANVFKYVNVHTDRILCDPVPDVFLSRLSYRERKPRLVCDGQRLLAEECAAGDGGVQGVEGRRGAGLRRFGVVVVHCLGGRGTATVAGGAVREH